MKSISALVVPSFKLTSEAILHKLSVCKEANALPFKGSRFFFFFKFHSPLQHCHPIDFFLQWVHASLPATCGMHCRMVQTHQCAAHSTRPHMSKTPNWVIVRDYIHGSTTINWLIRLWYSKNDPLLSALVLIFIYRFRTPSDLCSYYSTFCGKQPWMGPDRSFMPMEQPCPCLKS
jgi:hypothetical protein